MNTIQHGLPKPSPSCNVCGGDGWLDEPHVIDGRHGTGTPTNECPYCDGTGKAKK